LRHYKSVKPEHADQMVKYLLVDPASAKKKGSDYTTMWCIGLASDGNYYALDFLRDRLSLTERADRLFTLHRKWKPLQTRYEEYGMQADREHIQSRMESESYRFELTKVAGQTKKQDRIGRLIPLFEQSRIWLPTTYFVTNYEKTPIDLVRSFVEEEFMAFPVGVHDDMLDSLSRIAEPDLTLVWPRPRKQEYHPPVHHAASRGASWMGS
jgi:predicted phage terminase large subunit-like protein